MKPFPVKKWRSLGLNLANVNYVLPMENSLEVKGVSSWYELFSFSEYSTFQTPNLQSGQTHSNNSSTSADELFECVRPFRVIGA